MDILSPNFISVFFIHIKERRLERRGREREREREIFPQGREAPMNITQLNTT